MYNADREKIHLKINNNIYDVTEFSKKHPGGNIIQFYNCINNNVDATHVFNTFHLRSKSAYKLLKSLKLLNVNSKNACSFLLLKLSYKSSLYTMSILYNVNVTKCIVTKMVPCENGWCYFLHPCAINKTILTTLVSLLFRLSYFYHINIFYTYNLVSLPMGTSYLFYLDYPFS